MKSQNCFHSISGKCLYLLWMVAGFFITTIFCQNLRALLIHPNEEYPIEDHNKDVKFDSVKVALDFGKKLHIIVIKHLLVTSM